MARLPRVLEPGYPHHLCVRGAHRADIFLGDKDRHVYLRYLGEGAAHWRCDIHAYVLMSNHVHLLATGGSEGSVSRFMQVLNRRYSRYFNLEHGRVGTLYQGRYWASVVDADGYFFKVMQYIECNPVVAGMVREPGDYRWSSFRENASGEPGRLVRPHPLYFALGETPRARALAYARRFDTPLDPAARKVIRDGIWRGLPTCENPVSGTVPDTVSGTVPDTATR